MVAQLKGSRNSERVFNPQATRAGLRELELSGLSVPSGEELDYFAFYGIDFSHRISGVVHRFGSLPVHGFTIAAHYFQSQESRGTCILAHGYFDHSGLFGKLIEYCLRRGYNVLIWDLPGHGLSSGPQARIGSFEDYTEVLTKVLGHFADQLPRPWHAIGQSTGAAVLMSWAFRNFRSAAECPFDRMVLLAPLVRPAGWHWVKVAYALLRPIKESIQRDFVDNSGDAEFLAFVRADPLQSLVLPVQWVGAMRQWINAMREHPVSDFAPVVIQGSADETVDWKWNIPLIREKFPRAEFITISGARHHLANETPQLREQIFAAMQLG